MWTQMALCVVVGVCILAKLDPHHNTNSDPSIDQPKKKKKRNHTFLNLFCLSYTSILGFNSWIITYLKMNTKYNISFIHSVACCD